MANIDVGLVRGPQGPQGIKGDPFTYADFTESQITELQRPATEAATRADKATKDAQIAIAEVKATEAKLYPAAENVLKGNVKDTFIHVDDAFPSTLLGIEIEGATEQVTTIGKNMAKLTEGNKTSQGLDLDVKSSGQIVINGTCSGDGLWLKIGTVDVVEGKSYVLSLSKAYSSFGISAWSNSDNKHVIYTGMNSKIAKGTATKTETLSIFAVGGKDMTFNNEVVSIQVEEGTSATNWEPYTGGKPSPSPEYPQEIKVIENPVVKVMGRNLLDIHEGMPESDCSKTFEDSTKRIIKPGTYVVGLSFNNYVSADAVSNLKIADSSITFDTASSAFGIGVGIDLARGTTYIDNTTMYHSFYDSDGTYLSYSYSKQFKVPDNAAYSVAIFRLEGDERHFSKSGISITRVSDNGTYAPYTSQSITFTLPAEHPYLAKLPDGTADEIVVDRDGNVELVACMSKVIPKDIDTINFGAGAGTDAPYVSFGVSGIASKMGILCNGYQTSIWTNESGYIYCPNGSDIAIRDSRFTSKEKAIELLNDVVVYVAMKPTRYPLGKIEMPKAQDSITNVWTDAEVTPKTGIEYTRDVNIVVANLESAIASIS